MAIKPYDMINSGPFGSKFGRKIPRPNQYILGENVQLLYFNILLIVIEPEVYTLPQSGSFQNRPLLMHVLASRCTARRADNALEIVCIQRRRGRR